MERRRGTRESGMESGEDGTMEEEKKRRWNEGGGRRGRGGGETGRRRQKGRREGVERGEQARER